MALQVPPFAQYQSPLIPLRGLWNAAPIEGDRFVNVSIDWLVTTGTNLAVQLALSGNSPVNLSQIVALAVDNSRSGADVSFVFPDSGFELVIPAHEGGVFPVFTNALMFYAVALGATIGDSVVFQILNSMPPPVPISPTFAQNHASIGGINLVNGTTVLVPNSVVSGTLNTVSIVANLVGAGNAGIALVDGAGVTLWQSFVTGAASGDLSVPFNVTGLNVRFTKGINLVITASTFAGSNVFANVYYSTP